MLPVTVAHHVKILTISFLIVINREKIFSSLNWLPSNTNIDVIHWHLFFYFISNNNCRLLTINIVSFIFFLLSGIQATILFTLRKK